MSTCNQDRLFLKIFYPVQEYNYRSRFLHSKKNFFENVSLKDNGSNRFSGRRIPLLLSSEVLNHRFRVRVLTFPRRTFEFKLIVGSRDSVWTLLSSNFLTDLFYNPFLVSARVIL